MVIIADLVKKLMQFADWFNGDIKVYNISVIVWSAVT